MAIEIRRAGLSDLDGVLALLGKYHIQSIAESDKPDGFVTTNMTPEQMRALVVEEQGITIATQGDTVLSFAMAASWQFWSVWPLFAHMIEKLPEISYRGLTLGTENSYQYGPICVDASVRGSGLFEQVFHASLESMAERYPVMVTFINQINPRSLAAHTRKVGMEVVSTFQFNNNDYYTLACPTKP